MIIFVDGACAKNPGIGEYRVISECKTINFNSDKYPASTNNLMEFLALVKAIELSKPGDIIYSDSQTALAWVKKKLINTSVELSKDTTNCYIWCTSVKYGSCFIYQYRLLLSVCINSRGSVLI